MNILLLLLLSFNVSTVEALRSEARSLFFSFDADQTASQKLLRLTNQSQLQTEPLFIAYKGVAIASLARYATNPIQKLEHFNDGKNLLETAIRLAPQQAEIRLLRLSIQLASPPFLAYNANIEEDKSFIINQLLTNAAIFSDANFKEKVLLFLRQKAKLTDDESKKIDQLLTSNLPQPLSKSE